MPHSALRAKAQLEGIPYLVVLCPEPGSVATCAPLLAEARSAEVAEWIDEVPVLRLQIPDPDARRLLRLNEVTRLPSLLLFSPQGDLVVQRDGAESFEALQPETEHPLPLAEIAALRADQLEASRRAEEAQRLSVHDVEEALRLARLAIDNRNRENAARLLESLDPEALNLRQLVQAAELAGEAGRPGLAARLWRRLIDGYPEVGARAEALGRYARSMAEAGQDEELLGYVIRDRSLRSQWEYLSMVSALAAAGYEELASRLAAHGLTRFPKGSETEALRFYVVE